MKWMITPDRLHRYSKFIVGGIVNTAMTYAIYLALNLVLEYQIAYFIAYALGIVFAYCFNAIIVFHVPLSFRKLFSYPLVYVVQYAVSACLIAILVEFGFTSTNLAPLIVSVLMVPLTYIMSKCLLTKHSRNSQ